MMFPTLIINVTGGVTPELADSLVRPGLQQLRLAQFLVIFVPYFGFISATLLLASAAVVLYRVRQQTARFSMVQQDEDADRYHNAEMVASFSAAPPTSAANKQSGYYPVSR